MRSGVFWGKHSSPYLSRRAATVPLPFPKLRAPRLGPVPVPSYSPNTASGANLIPHWRLRAPHLISCHWQAWRKHCPLSPATPRSPVLDSSSGPLGSAFRHMSFHLQGYRSNTHFLLSLERSQGCSLTARLHEYSPKLLLLYSRDSIKKDLQILPGNEMLLHHSGDTPRVGSL